MTKIKIAILISGRGSNMTALIKSCQNADFPAEITCVFSDKPDAPGLQTARDMGVAAQCINRKDYADKRSFEQAMSDAIKNSGCDCVCFAGFMRVVSADFLRDLSDKIVLNIHPSLLPKHKGLHVHEQVLAAGDTQSGCSVHYVTPEIDSGEIIVQRQVDVMPDDTPESLAARVLEQEHIAYPQAIQIIAEIIAEKTA